MRDDDILPIDAVLLDRYLAGDATASERALVERWTASVSTARMIVEELQADGAFDDARRDGVTFDVASVRDRIERSAGLAAQTVGTHVVQRAMGLPSPSKSFSVGALRRTLTYGAAMAAGAFVVILGAFVLRWHTGAANGNVRGTPVRYVTGNGQRATITLSDGTTVVLNVASQLIVPVDFESGHRTLDLQGEALFTVPHLTGAPMVVRAGGTTTRVLGTSFVVRHYASDTTAIVSVREGKVSVQSMIVTAAQEAQVGHSGVTRVHMADESRFAFATGTLALSWRSLHDAIPDLDRWYDVDLRVADPSVAARPLEGKFPTGTRAELASLLELMYDVRVVREGRLLTLYPK